MIITRFGLESAKGFAEAHSINTTGLCLLFGGNSSGKSTVLQALMLLKQAPSPSRLMDAGISLEFRGPVVDLGGFRTFVHSHQASRTIRFELGLDRFRTRRRRSGSQRLTLRFGFGLTSTSMTEPRLTEIEIDDTFSLRFRYDADEGRYIVVDDGSLATFVEQTVAGAHSDTNESDLRWLRQRVLRSKARPSGWIPIWWPSDLMPTRPTGPRAETRRDLLEEFALSWYNYTSDLTNQLKRALEEIVYVAPLREFPRRVVTEAGSVGGLGSRGERLVLYLGREPDVLARVNAAFLRLGLQYELSVKQLTETETQDALGDVAVAVLKDRATGVSLSPADVGFGVSQVLPVIVQLVANRGSLIAIEQPEIHLHPKMQSRLADLIIASIVENHNQIVIETHSEHILTRIQRRIREGEFCPSNTMPLSVYYVAKRDGASKIDALRMDGAGRMLDAWPDDFIEERLDDLFGSI